MKRSLIILICMLFVLAILGRIVALLVNVQPEPHTTGIEPGVPLRAPIGIYELSSPVCVIDFEHQGQAPFSLVRLDDKEYQNGEGSDYLVPGFEGIPLDSSKISMLFEQAQSLTAVELLFETFDDLAGLGLDPPMTRIKVKSVDGEEMTLHIGKEIPGAAEVYVQVEGASEIYLVYRFAIENYFLAKTAFVSLTVTSSQIAASDFDRVTLVGLSCGMPDGRITVEAVGDERIRRITYPVFSRVDNPVLLSLQYIFLLNAKSVAIVNPSMDELHKLGFDEPYAIAEAVNREETFVLRFSHPDATGDVYMIRDGVPVLYTIAASEVLWLGKNYFDMMEKTAYAPDIEEVEEVAIETQGSIQIYRLSNKNGEFSAVYTEDKSLDPDSFRAYFKSLCAVKYEEAPDMPGGFPSIQSFRVPPDLRYVYRLRNGEEHVVSFYKGPIRRYYVYVDNGLGYLTDAFYVEHTSFTQF